jgi:hypothetical protein
MGRLIDADLLSNKINHIGYVPVCVDCMTKHNILEVIDNQQTAYDAKDELRLLKNYLHNKSKAYRQGNANYVIVRDLLMANTSHSGKTSCIMKCHELGIEPYGYDLEGAVKDE